MITEPGQAESILSNGQADAVFLARALLRDPYWPLHAAKELNAEDLVAGAISEGEGLNEFQNSNEFLIRQP